VKAEFYEIGPGKAFVNLLDFDWDQLEPGDTVRIHYREPPYHEKVVIRRSGTRRKPILIQGVPNSEGKFPVIDGDGALHSEMMCELWKSRRGLLILGDCKPASHLVIEGLEIKNANNSNKFKWGDHWIDYTDNAAGIFVNKGVDVKVKKCVVHGCCIGIFTSYHPDVDRFVLSSCSIYNNGDFKGGHWGHHVYIQAGKSLVQGNRFGELHSDGNSIKDRSGDTVIRYNWIEGGMSRQLDLVENKSKEKADAYVYGNVVVQGRKVINSNMIHFGGDVGGSRSGTLYFFNNTVYAKTTPPHAFFYIDRLDCTAELYNNVIIGGIKTWKGRGRVSGSHNLLHHGANTLGLEDSLFGDMKQFTFYGFIPFMPQNASLLVNAGTSKVPHKVKYMPLPSGGVVKRPQDGALDIGAFELR
jgi:hypothetical protein